jgi:glutathione synthase/RimK-type ligase-like ATP-grasp enzyme
VLITPPTLTAVILSSRPAVALATCFDLPDLDPDDRLLLPALAACGVEVAVAVWDDPAVDWAAFDLVVLRDTWDYAGRRDEFVAWAQGVPRLANPADIVRWNTDKRYLADLAAAGVPVVPTTWVGPGDAWTPPVEGEWVVKPAVSAGSRDTGRYDLADPAHRELAVAHVRRLQAADRLVMVQPYLLSVDSYGETGVLFLGGERSHAIRKGKMLDGPDPGDGIRLFRPEAISARIPTADEVALAQRTLEAVPGGADRLLYARVDMIASPDGSPLIVELELTEPSLFLGTAAGAPDRFAEAIVRMIPVVRS